MNLNFKSSVEEAASELQDIKGKKVSELSDLDKGKIMSRVLPAISPAGRELARDLIALKKPDHECSRDSCRNQCHYTLKVHVFDLLFAQEMMK